MFLLITDIRSNGKKSKILKFFKRIFTRKDRVTKLAEEVIDNEWALKVRLYNKLYYSCKEYASRNIEFDEYQIDDIIQDFGKLINEIEKPMRFILIKFGKGVNGIYKLNEYLEKYELPFRFSYTSEPKYGCFYTKYFIERNSSNLVRRDDDAKLWLRVNLLDFLADNLYFEKSYMSKDEFFVFASIFEDLNNKAFYGTHHEFDPDFEPSVSGINFNFKHHKLNFILKTKRNKKDEPLWFLEEYKWEEPNEELS